MEFLIFSILIALYWLDRDRRSYFHKRIDRAVFLNIGQTARNIAFMLQQRKLDMIRGDIAHLQKGAVLYSFHFGVWEMMPRTLARFGLRPAIIANRYAGDNKNPFARLADSMLFKFRSKNGVKVLYREDAREIVQFVKRGGIFGMLVDGDTFYAKFPRAEKLARLCGVPLLPFAAYRDKGTGVLDIGVNIDRLVRKRPYDYWWFYKSRGKAWDRVHGAQKGSEPLGSFIR